jgi:predicted ATPase/DNA-binding winged helix-turn-helix (wHTH) protein
MSSSAVARMPAGTPAVIEFGPFRFDPLRRELVGGNGPLRIGSRALQILDVLLETPGRLYSREELVERVWPSTIVEETSLRVHMSALRRLLHDGVDGARYIANVPGRGYAFVGDVRKIPDCGIDLFRAQAPLVAPTLTALPVRLARTIGREQVMAQIGSLLARERLVSIVGAGGMGKTTVAVSVADALQVGFEHGAILVDLSRISDPGFVAVEFGRTQGLNITSGDPPDVIEAVLRDRNVLFVVDNCEHVIEAVAVLVDRLMRSCPALRFLTTSREPLRAEGEWVFKLPPLAVPDANVRLAVAELLAYPAIQLFVERAKAISDTFELTQVHAPAVRQLCQFLDGIPLAIELAAARVDSLGVQGLVSRLESVFELLTRGRRTALPRHRTLQAVFDWSYELLSHTEKLVLQRLSVFRGTFDLEGAVTVACGPHLSREFVIDDVLGLCTKSLIVLETTGDTSLRHRLLYVTRLYAEKHLADSADVDDIRRRHAAFILERLMRKVESTERPFQHGWNLDAGFADLRAAIEWALIQENDLPLGLDLTARAMLSYRAVGLVEEYRHLVGTALGKISRITAERDRLELGLRVAWSFMTGYSATAAEPDEGFSRTQDLVARLGSDEDTLQSLYSRCSGLFGQGHYRAILPLCEEIRRLAKGELAPLSVVVADRFAALCLHGLGDHDAAERLALRVMAFHGARVSPKFYSEIPFGASMRAVLARIHWLRGDFSMAWTTLMQAMEHAANAHFFARCQVLGMTGIPLAIWKGDLATAVRWTTDLSEMADQKQLPYWQGFANTYRCLLNGEGIPVGSDMHRAMSKHTQLNDVAAVLTGTPPTAATMRRVEEDAVGWSAPEVLRQAAAQDLGSADPSLRGRAVAGLLRSMTMAQAQGARFWELRTALTVCSAALGGKLEAASLNSLRSILDAKDDGSPIAELVCARALLKERS